MAGTQVIINTKLHPPWTRERLVPRPRLSELLDTGLRPGCRLILISAPAGYGKTLLTATPVENDLEELFNLITLLFPGQLETAASFKRKYITKGDPLKPKNTPQLKRLIQEVMVRNRRSETGAIAGRRSAEVVNIELTGEEIAFYRRLTTFVRGYYGAGGDRPQAGVSQSSY